MKTIKQTTEIPYHHLEFSEKVVMLPIMDAVAQTIRDKENAQICLDLESAKKICRILSNLGCRTSQDESYENIIRSNNSQEELHRILLKNPGTNRIQIIEILKKELNLGLKEAKTLADCYPTIIDLDIYKIERSKYLKILSLLKNAGAAVQILKEEKVKQ